MAALTTPNFVNSGKSPRVISFSSNCFEIARWILKPRVFGLLLALFFLGNNFRLLTHTIADTYLAGRLVESDSKCYMQIAGDFAKGDFRCRYVKSRPHRQPLYPLLLAPAAGLSGNDPFWMGSVNVLVGMAGALILYFGILRLYQNHVIAAASGALFAGNHFIAEQVSGRLMTEPIHILIVILAALFFIDYVNQRKKGSFYLAVTCVGLDYLARTNGLFLMMAMMAVFLTYESGLALQVASCTKWQLLHRMAGVFCTFSVAVFVFVMVTFPSWVPRLIYLHNPIAHGYLSNYMWTDTYEVAHTGLPYVSYTWHDYISAHSLADILFRWGHGFNRVLFTVPLQREPVPILYCLAIAGIAIAVCKRHRGYALLAAVMAIQLLPLMWTSQSNPTPRVAYGGVLPFEFIFAAFALDRLRIQLHLIMKNDTDKTLARRHPQAPDITVAEVDAKIGKVGDAETMKAKVKMEEIFQNPMHRVSYRRCIS